MSEPVPDLVLWPLKRGETLSNHDWFPFYHHRFLHSTMFRRCVARDQREILGTALILWSVSIAEDPAGTLPMDDEELAELARFRHVDDWRAVKEDVLHGWQKVLVESVDGDCDYRLGHRFLKDEIVGEMGFRQKARKAGRDGARDRQKAGRVRKKLKGLGLPKHVWASEEIVMQMVRHFNLSGEYVTDENVRSALSSVIGYDGEIVPFPAANNKGKSGT